jgi:O-antigen/teichoic acid export membrane protein
LGLGLSQQLLLIPVLLHFWTRETLAAWLAIYAVGGLINAADFGLQSRAANRFFAFKSSVDCSGRTASFYVRMLQLYSRLSILLALLLLATTCLVSPSEIFGFQATPGFDGAFAVMAAGMALTLPVNLVTALYRSNGRYARSVWWQIAASLTSQIAQVVAIGTVGSVFAVAVAYISVQLFFVVLLLGATRWQFPLLRRSTKRWSWQWGRGQLTYAFPFGIAVAADLALLNLPILLISVLVADRVAVVQWGLTRAIAALVRALCTIVTVPVAAELAYDHAMGDGLRMHRLYGISSAFVTAIACVAVSGLLAFWEDFFELWTHGTVPYDQSMTWILLVGCALAAPSLMAVAFAMYSNRGRLLVQTKGLQLIVFVLLAPVLIHTYGLLGAATAMVAMDLCIQTAVLGRMVLRETLQHPARHAVFLFLMAALILTSGWGAGVSIRDYANKFEIGRFFIECAIWLTIAGIVGSPLLSRTVRARLTEMVPC